MHVVGVEPIERVADWGDSCEVPAADGTAEASFLGEVRDGACRWSDAVLGPDDNAAHADHFHFDRGPARICR